MFASLGLGYLTQDDLPGIIALYFAGKQSSNALQSTRRKMKVDEEILLFVHYEEILRVIMIAYYKPAGQPKPIDFSLGQLSRGREGWGQSQGGEASLTLRAVSMCPLCWLLIPVPFHKSEGWDEIAKAPCGSWDSCVRHSSSEWQEGEQWERRVSMGRRDTTA